MYRILSLLLIVLVLSGCGSLTIEKRHHRRGFFVQWNSSRVSLPPSKSTSEIQKSNRYSEADKALLDTIPSKLPDLSNYEQVEIEAKKTVQIRKHSIVQSEKTSLHNQSFSVENSKLVHPPDSSIQRMAVKASEGDRDQFKRSHQPSVAIIILKVLGVLLLIAGVLICAIIAMICFGYGDPYIGVGFALLTLIGIGLIVLIIVA